MTAGAAAATAGRRDDRDVWDEAVRRSWAAVLALVPYTAALTYSVFGGSRFVGPPFLLALLCLASLVTTLRALRHGF